MSKTRTYTLTFLHKPTRMEVKVKVEERAGNIQDALKKGRAQLKTDHNWSPEEVECVLASFITEEDR